MLRSELQAQACPASGEELVRLSCAVGCYVTGSLTLLQDKLVAWLQNEGFVAIADIRGFPDIRGEAGVAGYQR